MDVGMLWWRAKEVVTCDPVMRMMIHICTWDLRDHLRSTACSGLRDVCHPHALHEHPVKGNKWLPRPLMWKTKAGSTLVGTPVPLPLVYSWSKHNPFILDSTALSCVESLLHQYRRDLDNNVAIIVWNSSKQQVQPSYCRLETFSWYYPSRCIPATIFTA